MSTALVCNILAKSVEFWFSHNKKIAEQPEIYKALDPCDSWSKSV